MTVKNIDALREHLKSVPWCQDPRLVCTDRMADLGYRAGRYDLAQEVLAMLDQQDAQAEQNAALIDLRQRLSSQQMSA